MTRFHKRSRARAKAISRLVRYMLRRPAIACEKLLAELSYCG